MFKKLFLYSSLVTSFFMQAEDQMAQRMPSNERMRVLYESLAENEQADFRKAYSAISEVMAGLSDRMRDLMDGNRMVEKLREFAERSNLYFEFRMSALTLVRNPESIKFPSTEDFLKNEEMRNFCEELCVEDRREMMEFLANITDAIHVTARSIGEICRQYEDLVTKISEFFGGQDLEINFNFGISPAADQVSK